MFVAKLPGSTYAIAATNAGPRNGSAARKRPTRTPPRDERGSRDGCLMDGHTANYGKPKPIFNHKMGV